MGPCCKVLPKCNYQGTSERPLIEMQCQHLLRASAESSSKLYVHVCKLCPKSVSKVVLLLNYFWFTLISVFSPTFCCSLRNVQSVYYCVEYLYSYTQEKVQINSSHPQIKFKHTYSNRLLFWNWFELWLNAFTKKKLPIVWQSSTAPYYNTTKSKSAK